MGLVGAPSWGGKQERYTDTSTSQHTTLISLSNLFIDFENINIGTINKILITLNGSISWIYISDLSISCSYKQWKT